MNIGSYHEMPSVGKHHVTFTTYKTDDCSIPEGRYLASGKRTTLRRYGDVLVVGRWDTMPLENRVKIKGLPIASRTYEIRSTLRTDAIEGTLSQEDVGIYYTLAENEVYRVASAREKMARKILRPFREGGEYLRHLMSGPPGPTAPATVAK